MPSTQTSRSWRRTLTIDDATAPSAWPAVVLKALIVTAALLTATELRAQAPEDSDETDRDVGSMVVQGLGGAAAGLLLGTTAYLVVDRIADDKRIEGDSFYSPSANAALIAASAAGTALGVYVVGELLEEEGTFRGALLGSSVGALPLLLGLHDPHLPYYGLTIGIALQDIGALIGF